MGFKKKAIATLSIVSLLTTSIGIADFATADMVSEPDTITMHATTCAEAQNAINRLNENASTFNSIQQGIRITEDCSANLVIPSGKTILLFLYSEGENGQRTYHNLTDNGDDTITVAEGASLYYEGSGSSDGYVANTTDGKSIINNGGKVHIISGNFKAENGAYSFINTGELDLLGGNYIGFSVKEGETGKIRITDGTFDNVGTIEQYVVAGARLDKDTGTIGSVSSRDMLDLPEYLDCTPLPVGYTDHFSTKHVDYFDATETVLFSSAESVLKITGSPKEGWTFNVVGVGQSDISTRGIRSGSSGPGPSGYIAPSNAVDTNESLTKYLVDKFIEVIRQAIENGKTISIDINVRATTGASVEAESAIQKVIGNDTLIDYYDVSLALNGDGEKLTEVHDLEGKDVEIRIPATFLNRLEAVKSGYTRNYYVVRYHDGVAEKINAKLDGDDLVFKSSKFSTYAIAYNDTKITSGGGSNSGSHTGTSGSNNGSSNSNTNNTNNSSNSNNASNSGNNTGTNGSSNGLGAPDTGVASYLNNGNATVATASIVVVSAIASGVLAYKAISKKQRREK